MNSPETKSKTRTSRFLSFSAWLFAALAVFLTFSVNFQFSQSQSASSVQGQGTPRFLAKWVTGGAPLPLSVSSCSGSPASVRDGDTVTWRAIAEGGTPPYTVTWSGSNGLTGTGNPLPWTYSLPSGTAKKTVTAQATVTDADGINRSRNCQTVEVTNPNIIEVPPR